MTMQNEAILEGGGQVTLDGSGYGYLRFAPQGEQWEIHYTNVSVATHVKEAQGRTYIRQIGPQYTIDTTASGSTGDTSDTVIYLPDGVAVFFEWTGGDASAVASVAFRGFKSPPVGGFRTRS
jgi:hypothetical protein